MSRLPYDHGSPYTPEQAHFDHHHGTERAEEAQPGFESWRKSAAWRRWDTRRRQRLLLIATVEAGPFYERWALPLIRWSAKFDREPS